MRKIILIEEEVLVRLMEGKHVAGSLYREKWTGVVTFNAYKRLAKKRPKDRLIKKLPWGWVKESVQRIKRHTSVPNDLTLDEQLEIMDAENEQAKRALIESYIIDSY